MSVENVASKLGATLKIIIYGFILLCIVSYFVVSSVADNKEKRNEVVQKIPEQVQTATAPKVPSLEDKITVELLEVTPGRVNQITNTYSSVGLKVKINNSNEKPIQGIKGRLIVLNAFGDAVSRFNIESDETIQGNSSKTYDWGYELNVVDSRDQKITDLKKWTTKFEVEKILVE